MSSARRLRQSECVLSRTVGSEVLLSRPGHQDIDVLSGPASVVWHMLATPRSQAGITRLLGEAYGSEPGLEQGIRVLLRSLSERGLLEEIADGHA